MKTAYRIIIPVISAGAIVMGILLKLFYFAIGSTQETISSIMSIAQGLGLQTKYEFSVVDIIKLLAQTDKAQDATTFSELAAPVLPHIIAFIIFFALTLLMLLAIGIVAAVTGKRKAVIGMSAGGLGLSMICIIISRLAFNKIIGGEISLTDLMSVFSDSSIMKIVAAVVSITEATLSSGFYAVFGMYILIILVTVLFNMLISTPIQAQKKHRRKKPMKKLSAVFHR